MTTDDGFKIERTGNCFSMSSSEFVVTYPDGHVGPLWSPPWHEMGEDEEERECLAVARRLFARQKHKEKGLVKP